MARHIASPVIEIRSVVGAAGIDAAPFRTSGGQCSVQVIDAPANLVRVMGSVDGGTFALLNHEPVGGVAILNAIGAGVYEVRERPMWIRIGVNQDAAGPRSYRVQVLVHEHN